MLKSLKIFFLSLSVIFTSQASIFSETPQNSIESCYKALLKEDYKEARSYFSNGDDTKKIPSDEKLIQFKTVLKKALKKGHTGLEEFEGIYLQPYRSLSINLELTEQGKWLFTDATNQRIPRLFKESEVFETPEKTIAYFQKQVRLSKFEQARVAIITLKKDEPQNTAAKLTEFSQLQSKARLKKLSQIFTHIISNKHQPSFTQSQIAYNIIKGDDSRQIFLIRSLKTGDWKITPSSIRNIDKYHDLIIEDKYKSFVPEIMTKKTVLLQNGQWFGMLIIIILGVIAQKLLQFTLQRTIIRKIGREGEYLENKKAYRSISILSMALSWYLLLPVIKLDKAFNETLSQGLLLVSMITAMLALSQIMNLIYDLLMKKADETENKVDDVLIPMAHKTSKIILYTIGTLFILGNLGINVASLIAGLGIGGLAFALAAKDTIENLFGSITVLLDKPFEIGDWVVVDGVEGTVEKIGLRSTRIRTFYCSQVNVPNSTLISATVDNFGRRSYRRVKTMLSLTYDTPPAKIEAFCEAVRELIRQHPYMRKDYYHVYLNQFNGSSLDVLLYCFIDCDDWAIELREKQRLFMSIIRVANELGVDFAYPTQTLHMAKAEDLQPTELEVKLDEISAAYMNGRSAGSKVVENSIGKHSFPESVNYETGNSFSK